ncbi:MAG: SAM-dependent methyltransferase [Acidimicrobiales bacterium]
MTPVEERLREGILRGGPILFDEVVDLALYHPAHGFYAAGGQAGRRGDFLTSPEVGPLFGLVVARALDAWWDEAGQPPTFVVVEAGAGPGTLARSVLAAEPRCGAALRYVLVERAAAQRVQHADGLPLEDPTAAFAGLVEPGGDDSTSLLAPGGPIVVSRADLPRLSGPCIVLANELLDNLPFGLLEHTAAGWSEVHVGIEGDELVEVLLPTAAEGPDLPIGARIPRQTVAAEWVRDALALAGPDGRVVAIDYASTTADLAGRPMHEWLRTYRQHVRGAPPLEGLGTQDITCEVTVDQLPPPSSNRSQAEWLRAHGIDDLVAEGRRIWHERAGFGDLAAVRARSRITEAEALCDPTGLGAFRVLEWPQDL